MIRTIAPIEQCKSPAGALEELIAQHELDVTRTVRRLLGWRGDVEDVVQEVFLAACKQHHKFRGDARIKTWLIAIAIRRCRVHQRQFWKRSILARLRAPHGHAGLSMESQDDSLERDELAQQVRSAVQKLAPKDREIIVLYYLEELPVSEISKILRIKPNTIDVRLHRARKKLKELLPCTI